MKIEKKYIVKIQLEPESIRLLTYINKSMYGLQQKVARNIRTAIGSTTNQVQ